MERITKKVKENLERDFESLEAEIVSKVKSKMRKIQEGIFRNF